MPQVKLDPQKLEDHLFENVQGFREMNADQKEQISTKIQESINAAASSPLETDVWIYRITVLVLGLVILLTVLGVIFMFNKSDSKIPETLTALGSGALGALAGLLAPSPRQTNS